MVGRRRSREEHEGQRFTDQRRRSADPALMVNYDQAVPPYRGSGGHQHAHVAPRELPPGNKERRGGRPHFEDSGSDEGSSQSCDVITPTSITFTLEEADDNKSASSSSTLVENSSGSPPRQTPETTTHKPPKEQLSQETFGEDDRRDLVILTPLCEGVPMSSQPHYYDYMSSQAPLYYGLSQPSPPKSRHGKSLTDINSATAAAALSKSNLSASRQYLSQSVELPHYTQHNQQRYATDSLPRHARLLAPPVKHAQSSQIHRMASDSHLNYDGPPGQKMSMAGALARVREEIEQKQQHHSQTRQRTGLNQTRKQFKSHHLQKKHVQATVVSTTTRPKANSLEKRCVCVV